MKYFPIFIIILLCSCHSTTSKKKEVVDSPLSGVKEPHVINVAPDSIPSTSADKKEEGEERKEEPNPALQTADFVLRPIPRDIPKGEEIDPDSLSIQTEYDYYPLSTTKVKIAITNHSHYEYECGEYYSLAYYNKQKGAWEPLPVNPVINDVLWIFPPEHPTHRQAIKFYTSEVPNRAGRYRIYKVFNRRSKVAYAEFELISSGQHQKLLDKISRYYDAHRKDPVIQNLSTWGFRQSDTLYMDWMVNTLEMRELFRKKVLNYSAIVVNEGKPNVDAYLTDSAYTDTLEISMRTAKSVYPIGTESVSVELTNGNVHTLSMGSWYSIVRQEGAKWKYLANKTIWTLEDIRVEQGTTYSFNANLYPSLNKVEPGVYRVIKTVEFSDSSQNWQMSAEFKIE